MPSTDSVGHTAAVQQGLLRTPFSKAGSHNCTPLLPVRTQQCSLSGVCCCRQYIVDVLPVEQNLRIAKVCLDSTSKELSSVLQRVAGVGCGVHDLRQRLDHAAARRIQELAHARHRQPVVLRRSVTAQTLLLKHQAWVEGASELRVSMPAGSLATPHVRAGLALEIPCSQVPDRTHAVNGSVDVFSPAPQHPGP